MDRNAAGSLAIRAAAAFAGTLMLCASGVAQASSGGITGRSTAGCRGSGCHGSNVVASAFNYTSAINGGLGTIAPGAGANFTVQMTNAGGTNASAGGFNMSVTGSGSLQDGVDGGDAGSVPYLDSGELTHNAPRVGSAPSWVVRFVAGDNVGNATLRVCVNPVNLNGSGADDTGDGTSTGCTTRSIVVNASPTANANTVNIAEDSGQTAALNLLGNDFSGAGGNDGGDSISIDRINSLSGANVSTPHGSVTRSGNTVRYTPDTNYNGTDSFTYRISDSIGATDSATVTINISAVNDAPVAVTNTVAAIEDTSATFSALESNDTDIDAGDSLFIHAVTQGSDGGSVSIVSGNVSYVPAANFCGQETFTYRVRDRASAATSGVLLSNFATVTVNVDCRPDAPVAVDDTASVPRGSSNQTLAVLANDRDPDRLSPPLNGGLSIASASIVSPAVAGEQLSVSAGSLTLSYTPPSNFSGTRLLSYTVTDGGLTAVAQVAVTVQNGTAPVAVQDGLFTIAEDSLATAPANRFAVVANDTDAENDTLVAVVTSPTSSGTLSGSGTALLTYQPNPNFAGSDSFTYRAKDSANLLSGEITVSITVTPSDDPPDAVLDTFPPVPLIFREDQGPFDLTVLANDSDPDANDTREVTAVTTGDRGGTISVFGAGPGNAVRYNPAIDFNGTETFTYTIRDSTGLTDTTLVSVDVAPVDDAPVITSTALVTAADALQYRYQVTQSDVDDTAFTYVLTGGPVTGTPMSISAGGLVTWTPPISASLAPYTVGPITVTVTDAGGGEGVQRSATQTFSITVGAPDGDGDGMPDSYENAEGFDPADPADGAADRDGDGRSNTDEYTQGLDPDADDVAPVLVVPANLQVASTGFLTAVDLGVATATDVKDGVRVVQGPTPAGPFRPGRYVITYAASDAASNTVTATQQLDVLPRIELGPDQVTGEGRAIGVPVVLNGLAPIYPVTVDYTVGGTANGADHDAVSGRLVISSGLGGVIPANITADGTGEPDETLVVTLTANNGGVFGTRVAQTTTITERNVAPQASLLATQMGEPRAQIFADQGGVTIAATAVDPNAGDTVTLDFTGTDVALGAPAGNATGFGFDPAALAPGTYRVRVTARDAGGAASTVEIALVLRASAPALTPQDSDGDGLADNVEGFVDADGDGAPDYLDRYTETFVVADQNGAPATRRLLEASSGVRLRLGATALAAGRSGALVSPADVVGFGDGSGPVSNGTDGQENVGGLFDFELVGITPGASTSVVIPLQAGLRPGSVWRKYASLSGWRDFVIDPANRVASAAAVGGLCPAPSSPAYVDGLTSLHGCVRLTLQDGGPNDADGEANGRVRDPGGAAVAPTADPEPPPSGKSGGGSTDLSMLLGLWTLAFASFYRNRRRGS